MADDAIRQAEEASVRAQALEAAQKALVDQACFSSTLPYEIAALHCLPSGLY